MALPRGARFTRLTTVAITGLAVALSGLVVSAERVDAGRTRYSFRDAEKCMMKKINKRRAKRGLRQLRWDRQLGYVARKHARRMSRHRSVFHDGNLGSKVTRWRRLGQNVGTADGCRKLFRLFMRSSPHRHNIMGRWRHMGVGSKRRGGRLYVMHVFEARRDPGNIYHYP